MTNSTNNISADISMNGQKLEEFKVPWRNPMQEWYLLSTNLHQDYLSNYSMDPAYWL